MNIVYCSDNNFAIPTAISLVSIFENNKIHKIHAHILTDCLTDENKRMFKLLSNFYTRQITIHDVNSSRFSKFDQYDRYTLASYFRFLLPEIIDGDKALYLDGDIMVRGDLAELWNIDLKGYAVAVVEDQDSDDVIRQNKLNLHGPYFNSGMLLANLDFWRKGDYVNKLFDYAINNRKICKYVDQDVLNVIFHDCSLFVNPRFNMMQFWLTNIEISRLKKTKYPAILEAAKNPLVVHFSVPLKPWHKGCINPFLSEYLIYARLHSFIQFKQSNLHSSLYRFLDLLTMVLNWLKNKLTNNK